MDLPFDQAVLRQLPLADAVLNLWRWALDDQPLLQLYERTRGATYQQEITFPQVVRVTADALLCHHGSARQACDEHRRHMDLTVSDTAYYEKLRRLPTDVTEALLADTSVRMAQVLPELRYYTPPPSLRPFVLICLDGKAVKNVPKRLLPMRNARQGVLGGKALVALDMGRGLAIGMSTHPDGEANEARLVPFLLPQLDPHLQGQTALWIADSQFCDLTRPDEFTAGGHHFLVRYSSRTKFTRDEEQPVRTGIDAQGRVWREEVGWLGRKDHPARRQVRRITLERPGDKDVVLVTDLLDGKAYPAEDLLEAYLQRWGIERVFQQITEVFHLSHLIGTSPEGTLFQLGLCLLVYNAIQVIRAYVAEGAKRPVATVSTEMLFVDVRKQLTALYEVVGVEGAVALIQGWEDAGEVRAYLRQLLGGQWRPLWAKSPSRPRRGRRQSGDREHTSVYRILQAHGRPSSKKPPAPSG